MTPKTLFTALITALALSLVAAMPVAAQSPECSCEYCTSCEGYHLQDCYDFGLTTCDDWLEANWVNCGITEPLPPPCSASVQPTNMSDADDETCVTPQASESEPTLVLPERETGEAPDRQAAGSK